MPLEPDPAHVQEILERQLALLEQVVKVEIELARAELVQFRLTDSYGNWIPQRAARV